MKKTDLSRFRVPEFLKEPRWWAEHGVDVMTLVVTIVLAFFIHSLDQHDHERESAQQDKSQRQQRAALNQLDVDQTLAVRQNGAENDAHQAITLLSEFELETETGHEARRRATARVIKRYALAGRLYEPSVEIFLDPLSAECDPETFSSLTDALAASVNVARRDAATPHDTDEDRRLRTVLVSKVKASVDTRNQRCGGAVTQVPLQRPSPLELDIPLGYIDVGCEQRAESDRNVLLSTVVKPGYRLVDASAAFINTSNIKDAFAKAAPPEGNVIKIHYSLVGLDSQAIAFGIKNCPGGGHGTLVLHARLAAVE